MDMAVEAVAEIKKKLTDIAGEDFCSDDAKLLENFYKQFWVIEKLFKRFEWTEEEIEEYRSTMEKRWKMGSQFGFMPSFYAIGKKTES